MPLKSYSNDISVFDPGGKISPITLWESNNLINVTSGLIQCIFSAQKPESADYIGSICVRTHMYTSSLASREFNIWLTSIRDAGQTLKQLLVFRLRPSQKLADKNRTRFCEHCATMAPKVCLSGGRLDSDTMLWMCHMLTHGEVL